jgi:hypothetical protein
MEESMKRVFMLFMVIALVILGSCAKPGVSAGVKTGTDANFEVEFLFEIDGVKIYRFYDAGYHRYFSIGEGSFLPQKQTSSNGKSTTQWVDGVAE